MRFGWQRIYNSILQSVARAGELGQKVRCLLSKPNDLSSIPRSHMKVYGENQPHVVVL